MSPQENRPRSPRGLASLAALFLVTAAAASALTFTPDKDAMVKIKFPDTNFGADVNLQASNKSGYAKHIFAQFTVSGIPTGATNIVAKLHLNSSTTLGSAPVSAHTVSNLTWGENTITWNNQPALGSTLDTISSFTAGADAIWTVSSAVTGNGTFCFGLDSTYIGGDITFSSKEGTVAPTLVVTYTISGVTVINGNLALDGALWIPKGLVMLAWVHPDAGRSGLALTAWQHWGQAELDAAKNNWHADLLRFQVSVCALDPQGAIYDPNYLTEIVTAVNLARSSGFKVLLSMQHQSLSGCAAVNPMPQADVTRAWQALAPQFNGDHYVMYEIYNEPDAPDKSLSPTSADWALWQNGDGGSTIGHQALLNTIRATGSTNLVLADGLRQARTFGNSPSPLLTDSANNVAFAVHTYFNGGTNNQASEWDTHFGNFHAAGNAVLGTEWNACANLSDCRTTDPTDAANLISYMRTRNMGNSAWAFDKINNLTLDWTWTPNFYDANYTCSPSGTEGPGTIIKNDYTAH